MIREIDCIELFLKENQYYHRVFYSRQEIVVYNSKGRKEWLVRGYNAPESLFALYRVNYMGNGVEELTEASEGLIGAEKVMEIIEEGL